MSRFTLSDLLFLTTVAAVVCGGFAYDSGWGSALMLVLVPVAVRTQLALQRRAAIGVAARPHNKTRLLASSLGVVLLGYAGVAVWVAAAVWAWRLATTPADVEERLWLVGKCLAAMFGLLLVTILARRWVSRRWWCDTTGESNMASPTMANDRVE